MTQEVPAIIYFIMLFLMWGAIGYVYNTVRRDYKEDNKEDVG